MLSAIALVSGRITFNPVAFAIGFVLVICAVAVVIILVKWLLGLADLVIPQPLLLAMAIIVFMLLLLLLANYTGLYVW